jgi:hypothetical protein
MNSLKRSALIHQNTTIANFRSIFSAKEIEQKIIWTGNISELATLHQNPAQHSQKGRRYQTKTMGNNHQLF